MFDAKALSDQLVSAVKSHVGMAFKPLYEKMVALKAEQKDQFDATAAAVENLNEKMAQNETKLTDLAANTINLQEFEQALNEP